MKSDDITIQQLFQDRRQFMVPFYQRAYVWTLANQWEQLWEDIRAKAESRLLGGRASPHFLGAVVLDPQPKKGLIGVDSLHIIDGQQRLTTLQFVLKSVLLILKESETSAIAEIISGCLKNSNPDTMREPEVEVFKVWPTFRDREDYKQALTAANLTELRIRFSNSFTQRDSLRKIGVAHPPALEAIWFFTDRFKNWISEGAAAGSNVRCEALATAILQDLKVVSIVLDKDDDAQVIFETLNGRGARLHATDLIRNFIFMRADREDVDSKSLYNSHWQAFETTYWNEPQRRGRILKPRLEWFIHASLQAELGQEIDLGRLYFEYRRFVFDGAAVKTAKTQLEILAKFAAHYRELVDGKGDTPIAVFGRRTSSFDITTTHPLALIIGAAQIPDNEKTEMLTTLFSYVVRRAVCGLTQKNYNNVFFSVLRSLSKSGITPQMLRQSFLSLKGDASRWPDDAEFRNACINAPLYPGRLDAIRMRTVLAELELKKRQTVRSEDAFGQDMSNLDIDHILPKKWFEYWPLSVGPNVAEVEATNADVKKRSGLTLTDRENAILARQETVPTLGNLTLLNLSVNREAQHKAFLTKRDLLLANTNLRLNVELLGYSCWDEALIKSRSEQLADLALQIWPGLGDVNNQ